MFDLAFAIGRSTRGELLRDETRHDRVTAQYRVPAHYSNIIGYGATVADTIGLREIDGQ